MTKERLREIRREGKVAASWEYLSSMNAKPGEAAFAMKRCPDYIKELAVEIERLRGLVERAVERLNRASMVPRLNSEFATATRYEATKILKELG